MFFYLESIIKLCRLNDTGAQHKLISETDSGKELELSNLLVYASWGQLRIIAYLDTLFNKD